MNITRFTMEEVRCFAERQQFEIRPLTFLVGENSTGKTTMLSCFQALANYVRGYGLNMNLPPYSMGIFRDIVRSSRKTEKAFKLGFSITGGNEKVECTVEFAERRNSYETIVKSITMKFSDGEMVFTRIDDTTEWSIGAPVQRAGATTWTEVQRMRLASIDEKRNHFRVDVDSHFLDHTSFPSLVDRVPYRGEGERTLANYLEKKENQVGVPWWRIGENLTVISASPIRSQPKRAYNLTSESYDPEGSVVPERMRWIKTTNKKRWEDLKVRLVEFGKCSGLFENIDVRNFGGSMSNPFQLRVKVRGPHCNIVDVGYGVSQILPILVNSLDPPLSLRAQAGTPFLMLQQPEVHLHPRAQAELTSLLAKSARQGPSRWSFIVETHSDYMIDRARIEVRKGTIRPDDVSLVYLEPKGNIVKAHNIRFDKMGNMEGVPPHYREFFLKETDRLMGFED